jgi:hypothetical protein
MKIVVEIPDAAASVIHQHMLRATGQPVFDPVTRISTVPPRYPEGITDWVREIVEEHVTGFVMGAQDLFPEVKARLAAVNKIHTEMKQLHQVRTHLHAEK